MVSDIATRSLSGQVIGHGNVKATREDVIACYRHILGRAPEDEETLSRLVGWDFWQLVQRFAHSEENKAAISTTANHSLLKFKSDVCLSRDLDPAIRLKSIVHNYAFLCDRLAADSLLLLVERGLPVYAGSGADHNVSIDASLFDGPAAEGEVSLILSLAGRRLAVLSFTIVVGGDFGVAAPAAFLISRLQGYRGAASDVAAFIRAVDIAPPRFLLAALHGVAAAFGVSAILGVNATNHPSFRLEEAEQYKRAYDDFFVGVGADRLPAGLYRMRVPATPVPLDLMPRKHRARRRRRRAVRDQVTRQAHERCRGYLFQDRRSRLGVVRRAATQVRRLVSSFLDLLAITMSGGLRRVLRRPAGA